MSERWERGLSSAMTYLAIVALMAAFPPEPIEEPAPAPTPAEKLADCRMECLGTWSDCQIAAYGRWIGGGTTTAEYMAERDACGTDWDACVAGCYFAWATEILQQ